ncbi:hypothetical protein Y10_33270 [Neptunitalea sp. Y10]|uniref:DUF4249 domain-containing protein n=2 Tax=Neptunitalea lumnitzerae TaxID=2965509 RepID=A0ABQ5MNJ8_9FLAO|nr:hypothetical protein Y10_33270 [Neptunitalea sp. Y10]
MLIVNIFLLGCTEPYPIASENFEELLVVNATLTDSLQYQTVRLTNSYPLNTDTLVYVNNATVYIRDNNNQIFNFSQVANDSTYISDMPFKAVENASYSLHITTQDGREYQSTEETTPQKVTIDNLYAEARTNQQGVEGVQIYTDVTGTNNNNLYCRYEYDETFKIVTPYTVYADMEFSERVYFYNSFLDCWYYFYYIMLHPVEEQTKIGYKTNTSNTIVLANNSQLISNTINKVENKFIPKDDYVISERYSFLVYVYSENYQAYQYFETLKKLNSQESSLSPNQPGFIQGNISNVSNQEKIIGYFNVASVKTKRIFFDFSNFGFSKPAYFSECYVNEYDYRDKCALGIYNADLLYYDANTRNYRLVNIVEDGIYTLVNPECADCTTFASNVKPDFWED